MSLNVEDVQIAKSFIAEVRYDMAEFLRLAERNIASAERLLALIEAEIETTIRKDKEHV